MRRGRSASTWGDPRTRYALLALGAQLALTLALALGLRWHPVLAWVAAINLVAFITYGYDKRIAGSPWMRVPERVLLGLALFGGTLGALAGMMIFRHKTRKSAFLTRFFLIVALQAILLAAYWFWPSPKRVYGMSLRVAAQSSARGTKQSPECHLPVPVLSFQ